MLLIHNPKAGGGNMEAEDLISAFEQAGHEVKYRPAKEEKIAPADAECVELVMVAGGDGTVGRAVKTLGSSCRRLGIVPFGTANNIASFLGIEGGAHEIAREIYDGEEHPFDVGVAEGPWGRRMFLEGVGIGAIASMIEAGEAKNMDSDAKRQFGESAPASFLGSAKPQRWQVSVDGEVLPEELLLVEVLNIPVVGPGLHLAAKTRPGDGRFDVAFVRPERRGEFIDWLGSDRTTPPAAAEVVQGRQMTFVWAGGPLRIDDGTLEFSGETRTVVMRIGHEQISVLVPRGRSGDSK